MTLGRPVEPLDAIAIAGSATTSGSGSVERSTLARTSSVVDDGHAGNAGTAGVAHGGSLLLVSPPSPERP